MHEQRRGQGGYRGDDEARPAWRERRERDAARAGVLSSGASLYRPRELLVAARDEERLLDRLREAGGERDPRTDRLDRVGLRLWTVADGQDLPALVRDLRRADGDAPPGVALNAVLSGEPKYIGGPGGPPRATKALDGGREAAGADPVLAVLDTGWSRDLAELHPALAALQGAGDEHVDLLDSDADDELDTEAGHGTFVCGLVQRTTPGLPVEVRRVLDPYGFGDDVTVALGLLETAAPVVNLSLGGYTEDDAPPPALAAALAELGRDRAVVAAAGNDGSTRPFWPAAAKHVVAVAAADTTAGTPRAAAFTNRGPWVDVCAPGVHLQGPYVRGRQDAGAGPQAFEGWACWSGTSFAAPLVAAAVAVQVAEGARPRAAVARLLADLEVLPGLDGLGVWFDPGVDLLCRAH